MNKYTLIEVSICAVVLLVLGSMNNIVGYQAVQASNQKIMNSGVDQKELLFQTIVDMANNKELQRLILKSQIYQDGFLNPDVRFPMFNIPVLKKNQLKQMYLVGLILSKTSGKTKLQLPLKQYQANNQMMQKEISAIIEKDMTLKDEMMQLSNISCDCGNENSTDWSFPIICLFLYPIVYFSMKWVTLIYAIFHIQPFFISLLCEILTNLGLILHCFWTSP